MPHVECEWGWNGVATLRDRCAVLVIVDVLSFSTAVEVAVSRGGVVFPFPHGDEVAAQVEAERVGARLASRTRAGDQLSLSPVSLMKIEPGDRLVLPSPNGSRLSLEGGQAEVIAGCLRNRTAVVGLAKALAGEESIGVIPAGERWPDGSLRPALEDWLGAGAVIDAIGATSLSAEARAARAAFRAARDELGDVLRGCMSGRELIDRGFPQDVEIALALDVSGTAPRLMGGAYRA
ncbi:MAG TPA: 2-phosphosulfolactate phosphatase [Phenylobacterium sp.]|nr:2-phosphosulfolactate phosphatase [Phenylobacterium sp.]